MKKSNVLTSTLAPIFAGLIIYKLKKREEKIFKQEYKNLQESYQAELEKLSEIDKI